MKINIQHDSKIPPEALPFLSVSINLLLTLKRLRGDQLLSCERSDSGKKAKACGCIGCISCIRTLSDGPEIYFHQLSETFPTRRHLPLNLVRASFSWAKNHIDNFLIRRGILVYILVVFQVRGTRFFKGSRLVLLVNTYKLKLPRTSISKQYS